MTVGIRHADVRQAEERALDHLTPVMPVQGGQMPLGSSKEGAARVVRQARGVAAIKGAIEGEDHHLPIGAAIRRTTFFAGRAGAHIRNVRSDLPGVSCLSLLFGLVGSPQRVEGPGEGTAND